jgi:hypothetical protein
MINDVQFDNFAFQQAQRPFRAAIADFSGSLTHQYDLDGANYDGVIGQHVVPD